MRAIEAEAAPEWIDAPFPDELPDETPTPPASVTVTPRNTRKPDERARVLRERAAALHAEARRLEAMADERESGRPRP